MDCSFDDDRLTLAGLLFETSAGLMAEVTRRRESESGLTPSWFEVLLRLARSPEGRLRMSDLAREVVVTPSGLTRSVDRMEQAGLVRRESCPSDRRVAYAVPTAEGRHKIEAALPGHIQHLQECLVAHLDAEERAALQKTLTKLRDTIRAGADCSAAATGC